MRNMGFHLCVLSIFAIAGWSPLGDQAPFVIQNANGLRLPVAPGNTQPTLRVVLTGDTDGAIEAIFPEHVTARRQGNREAEHFYLFRPGQQGFGPSSGQENVRQKKNYFPDTARVEMRGRLG